MIKVFENKWTLILGGSSGLGLASVKKLASHGMNLIIVHRDRKIDSERLEEIFNHIRNRGSQVISFNENALDVESRKQMVSNIQKQLSGAKIYALIHSIAKGNLKQLYSPGNSVADKSDLDITMHAMATSWWEWTKELVGAELWHSDARNIAFTSEGNQKYIPGYVAVSAAKASLEVLCRYMAVELAPLGIKTNLIQSGVVPTPSMKMIPNADKILELTQKRNPFGRLTTPEDIANTVYLLCLQEACWINGAIIKADGGESL
jgi:NAD(P)-dependent dehydrogenase (short-subunit alcohol dehydrogenase family)